MSRPPTAAAPLALGSFHLHERVGQGAAGVVWRASHGRAGFPVALKILLGTAGGLGLHDEIDALASLDHPNVARLLDVGVVPADAAVGTGAAEGAPWFASEWAAHGTLQAHVGAWPWETVRRVVGGLLDALAHAHGRGVLHLDVKPANVLLARDPAAPTPLLTDFGIARRLQVAADGRWRPRVAGTPAYMPTEQLAGEHAAFGPWTDLYALAALVTELVTGAPPRGDGDVRELRARASEPLPRLAPVVPVPPGLEAWLARLLAPEPRHRPGSAAEAADTFLALGPPAGAPRPRPPRPSELPTLLLGSGGAARVVSATPLPAADRVVPTRRATERGPARTALLHAGTGLVAVRRPAFGGRAAECAFLWGRVAHVRRGTHLVLTGPRGVGRSRLGTWLVERVRELGFAEVLTADARPRALAAGAAAWLGVVGTAPRPSRDHLLARLAEEAADPAEVAAWTEWLVAGALPDDVGARLVARRVARRGRRTLVWLDDADEAPGAEVLVRALVEVPAPVLVVSAPRDPARFVAGEACGLPPLEDTDLRALLDSLLPLGAGSVRQLVSAAEGCPGAAVDTVRHAAVEGRLRPTSRGTYELAPAAATGSAGDEVPAVALPALVAAALLDEPWESEAGGRVLAEVGAVVPHALLARLVREGRMKAGRSTEALRASVLARVEVGPWHARCARAVGDQPLRAARHLLLAGEPLPAPIEVDLGYERAHADPVEAKAVLDEAEERLRTVESRPRWRALRVEQVVLAALAEDEAGLAARLAAAREAGAGDDPRVAHAEGVAAHRRGDLPGAAAAFARASAAAAARGWTAVALRARYSGAIVARLAGRLDEAAAACSEVLRLAGPAQAAVRAGAAVTLGRVLRAQGRMDEARVVAEAALTALGAAPMLVRRAELLSHLASIALRQGRDDEALGAWRRSVDLLGLAGSPAGGILANLVLLELRRGELDAALEASRALLSDPGTAPVVGVATARAALLTELASASDETWATAVSAVPRPPYGGREGLIEVLGQVARRIRAATPVRAGELERLRAALDVP